MGEGRRERKSVEEWDDGRIELGESRDLYLKISESSTGVTLRVPLHVVRGLQPGPTVFVTAALHGDEINGTGAVRSLIMDQRLQLKRGSLILVPVLNPLGFDRHSRYLPDRRDLNRCFPGSARGSVASRLARFLFDEIVLRSDYGIDLHTAAIRRTNFPNIRADLSSPQVAEIASAFGCEFVVNGRGPRRALRREAVAAGCPTIVFEGGEVWKVEPAIVACALRGVHNVLSHLGMIAEPPTPPPFRITIEQSRWVRAERGGFLQFHVAPGDLVKEGQPIATNTSLLGKERNVLNAPFDGAVIGMTTLPSVSPGEPVCHIGKLPKGATRLEKVRVRLNRDDHYGQMADDLATNLMVEPFEGDEEH